MKDSWKSIFGKFGVVFAAMILFISPSAAWAGEKINIRYLAQGKKVIPVTCSIGNWQITDIKLPDLVVTNNRKIPVTVYEVEVIGKISGVKAVRLLISGEPLTEAIRKTAIWLNDPETVSKYLRNVQLSFGNVVLPQGTLSENGKASPGQSIVLPLSTIAYLHHVGQAKIDDLEINLTLKSGGTKTVTSFPVQLIPYEQKGTYAFPLKGDMQMAFLPLSYIHHRASASQEFAIDLVGANQGDAASFTDISRPNPRKLSDYSVWGREVLAMGDGVVVETGDRFPEGEMSDPDEYTKPGYVENLIKRLIPTIGWTNAMAGNYVVIEHQTGEFGAYCHLQEGSIRVAPGDRVSKGTVIAKVGNTGNSGAPHLHFQLMDSQDFFTANGLPMTFENVPVQVMVNEYPVTANTLSFSDSIFRAVP